MKTFMEVGTCDFWTLRHLCDRGWKGIMVEPHKPFLDNIPDHENLIKINKAMDNKIGTASYTKIKDDKMFNDPEWEEIGVNSYRGMGSIFSGNVLHIATEFKDVLETYEVPTTTFDEVMESLGIDTIDYLKIDTEGWDFQIFETIDFEKYKINIIKMETGYCDPDVVADILDDYGYHIEIFENDILAFKL